MSVPWLRAVAIAFAVPVVGGVACSVQSSGTGGNADASVPDVLVESSDNADTLVAEGGDAGPVVSCSQGILCNGACVDAGDCRSCSGAPLLCAAQGACVATCSGCVDKQDAAKPIECFACDSNHQNPLGTCEYDDAGSYCLSGTDFGAYVDGSPGFYCSCDDGGCPGTHQVCAPLGRGSFCLSCGQISTVSLDEAGCSGGGTCRETLHHCK